jgi:hypothetical protein
MGALIFLSGVRKTLKADRKKKVRHSTLTAAIGSTLVARRAGIQQASSATTMSVTVTTTSVIGSVALTPNNRLFIRRVSTNALREFLDYLHLALRCDLQ